MQKINYDDLRPRQQECYNFQKASAVLAEYGFECLKLSDDWQGADFIANSFDGKTTLKVQLKSRMYIKRDYMNKSLHILFPSDNGGKWILIPHDTLLEIVSQECPDWLKTDSWIKSGCYHRKTVGRVLSKKLQPFEI